MLTMISGMWLMLQQDKPDDFVLATGHMHSVREFVEVNIVIVILIITNIIIIIINHHHDELGCLWVHWNGAWVGRERRQRDCQREENWNCKIFMSSLSSCMYLSSLSPWHRKVAKAEIFSVIFAIFVITSLINTVKCSIPHLVRFLDSTYGRGSFSRPTP